mgnify:CR=1 FL=1
MAFVFSLNTPRSHLIITTPTHKYALPYIGLTVNAPQMPAGQEMAVFNVGGGIGIYVTYLTVVKLGAGRAVFISNTYVVWGALLAAWMLREKLRPAVLVGGAAPLAMAKLVSGSATIAPAERRGLSDE